MRRSLLFLALAGLLFVQLAAIMSPVPVRAFQDEVEVSVDGTPTDVPTETSIPIPPTETNTAVPSETPTPPTETNTAVPPTNTAVPPTSTNTAVPSATSAPSGTAVPSLTSTPAETLTPTATPYKGLNAGDTIEVTTGLLNVRNQPTTSGSSVIKQIARGQQFLVLEGPVTGGAYEWIRLELDNQVTTSESSGWVAAQYVKVAIEGTPPEPTAVPTETPVPTETTTPTETATLTGSETATATATNTPTVTATPTASGTKVPGAYSPGDLIVVRTSVNVRSGPGTNNGVLGVAPTGLSGVVKTGNTVGGSYQWIEVDFATGPDGWVASNYVNHQSLTTPTPSAQLWKLSVALDCRSSPETITITNSMSSSVTIYSIATVRGETGPYTLNQTLGGKQSRTYQAGGGASGQFVLTNDYILLNKYGSSEGVVINTSAGQITRSCADGSSGARWVKVDLSEQRMYVYQGNSLVTTSLVSTGKPGFSTPKGDYYTYYKAVSVRMAACVNGECWDTPNVPFSQLFRSGGFYIHGAYWHDQFGTVRSHGCVNLPVPFSEWLYYWLPLYSRVVIQA